MLSLKYNKPISALKSQLISNKQIIMQGFTLHLQTEVWKEWFWKRDPLPLLIYFNKKC